MSDPKVPEYDQNKKFWTEFITLYESLPELWDLHNGNYTGYRRTQKIECIETLVEKLQEIDPSADIALLNTHLIHFREELSRHLKKIAAIEKGELTDYKPKWFVGNLKFLVEVVNQEFFTKKHRTRSRTRPLGMSLQEAEKLMEQKRLESQLSPEVEPEPEPNLEISVDLNEDLIQSHRILKENSIGTQVYYQYSEDEILLNSWKGEFKKMPPDQQYLAIAAIEMVFYRAKLGLLTKNSVQINNEAEKIRSIMENASNVLENQFNAPMFLENCGQTEPSFQNLVQNSNNFSFFPSSLERTSHSRSTIMGDEYININDVRFASNIFVEQTSPHSGATSDPTSFQSDPTSGWSNTNFVPNIKMEIKVESDED